MMDETTESPPHNEHADHDTSTTPLPTTTRTRGCPHQQSPPNNEGTNNEAASPVAAALANNEATTKDAR